MWNIKKDMKNVGNRTVLVPIDFFGNQNCMVTNVLENMLFYVLQRKKMHSGLEQQNFHFWVNYAYNICNLL